MTISGHLYNHMQKCKNNEAKVNHFSFVIFINPLKDQNLIQNHRKFLFFLLYNQ